MSQPHDGRISVEAKLLWSVVGTIAIVAVTWGALKYEVTAHGGQLKTQWAQIQDIKDGRHADNMTQQRVSDQVEGIKQQVIKLDSKTEQLTIQQQAVTQQLYEQGYTLKRIFEEVKKP